jgi:Big-like domain-containing protein
MRLILSVRLLLFGGLVLFCSNFGICEKTASYTQVVDKAATTITMSESTTAVNIGQSIQFTANVAPIKPTTPTGTVVFTATGSNSNNQVVSAPAAVSATGISTWSIALPNIDTYTIKAVYSGDANYLGSNTSLVAFVAPPQDFLLGLPSRVSVTKGQASSGSIAITPINGFSGIVTLSCSGSPYKGSCGFANAAVAVSSNLVKSNIQNANASATTTGTVTTDLKIDTSGITVTTVGTLLCLFGVRGRRKHYAIALSACCLLLSMVLVGCAGSNRYVQNDGTPVGTYTISVVATSGSITHKGTVTLDVLPMANSK